jgi:hypothetical protein
LKAYGIVASITHPRKVNRHAPPSHCCRSRNRRSQRPVSLK